MAEWTVVHIERPFKGRAEPMKLLLEDAGVNYSVRNEPVDSLLPFDMWRDVDKVELDSTPFPVMFPPVLWHRPAHGEEVYINTHYACLRYLGRCLGYQPASAAETARADQILQNAVDFWWEGRMSFHPLDSSHRGSYLSQKEEGDKTSLAWSSGRMQIWLQHFEKLVKRFGPEGPVAGGAAVTYADFILFHALDAAEAQFNTEFYGHAWDAAQCGGLQSYKAYMARRPRLQAYMASDRRKPWAGDSMC